MRKDQRTIQTKLELLTMAQHLGNVSQACRLIGYSRESYYRIKGLYETGGEAALEEVSRKKPLVKNRAPISVEQAVVAQALAQPSWGQARVARELRRQECKISPAGVRSIWLRYHLETTKKRVRALEAGVAQDRFALTEAQAAALEKAQAKRKSFDELQSEYPGSHVVHDISYIMTLKGLGQIYQQTFIDSYSKLTFAKLYHGNAPLPALDLFKNRLVPFFETNGLLVNRIVTVRGTEMCGPLANQEFEKYLVMKHVIPLRANGTTGQTQKFIARFHQLFLNDFYRIAVRKTAYLSLKDLQADLDSWLEEFNQRRPYEGPWCYGKTPMQTFLDSLAFVKKPAYHSTLVA